MTAPAGRPGGVGSSLGVTETKRRAASQVSGTPAARPDAAPTRKPRRVTPCEEGEAMAVAPHGREEGGSLLLSYEARRGRVEYSGLDRPARSASDGAVPVAGA